VADVENAWEFRIGPNGHAAISEAGKLTLWRDGVSRVVDLPQTTERVIDIAEVLGDGAVVGVVPTGPQSSQVVRVSPAGEVTPVSDGTAVAHVDLHGPHGPTWTRPAGSRASRCGRTASTR